MVTLRKLYREETQVNKNKFCMKRVKSGGAHCRELHRNGDKDKVSPNENSILAVMPVKDHAFVQTIGNASHVSESNLEECTCHERTLVNWTQLCMLAEIAN